MSLTRELTRRDSWVNRFFKERFPKVVDFARREGRTVKALQTRIPTDSAASSHLVGTAFDYRLRIHFKPDFANSDILSKGIERLLRAGSSLGPTIDGKWADATVELLADMPAGDADLLARASRWGRMQRVRMGRLCGSGRSGGRGGGRGPNAAR